MATGGKSRRGGRRGHNYDSDEVRLSKALSSILRHKFQEFGLTAYPGGYIDLDAILSLPKFRGYTEEMVREVVQSNEKQRFSLRNSESTGKLQIRANQGHTVEDIDLELTQITDASLYPTVIHGTYRKHIASIKSTGLSRMDRNHIHFAPGLPGDVISGMRSSCEVYIEIDMKIAIKDGYKFYVSDNNVILCAGNELGFLPPKYFKRIVDRVTGNNA